ncbi:MAG: sensor histidine kinase, partial [Thermoplasmata archaeon]|nr:sensor histidine kinase [Thermoplasmata archaeon]
YWHGDSSRWLELMDEGYYFGDIELDPMTGTPGMNVSVRLDGPDGNTIGALMASLNIVGVMDESVYLGKAYSSTQFRVVSLDGRMIYSDSVFHVFEDVSDEEYFSAIAGQDGYFIASESDRERLFAYAVSSGYLAYDGDDWIVLVDHETSEVLQPVEDLRTSIILASATVIILSMVLYELFAHSISRRIRTLAKTAEGYSRGDFGARVDVRSIDEIGQLAKAFNSMASELETLCRDLEGRVQLRTSELEQAMKKLHLLGSITRHDALNQVAVVMGWAAVVEDSTDDKDTLIQLGKITEAAANLERYLKFTGVYEMVGVKQPEWMELGSVLTESLFGLGPREFELHNGLSGVHISADSMFPKVFRNLLDNTIEHGGNVTRVSLTYREGPDGLVIVYEDDGPGIPEDMKESIFESRAHSGRKSFGLYLSTEILSITGMTMRETGEPGNGARFEILVQRGHYRIDDASPRGM